MQPKCFQIIVYELKAMNSLNLLEVSKLLLFVSWQLQSKCFQVLASQLKSNEFLTPLKLSIRVLAGAIRMLPNHCFSMESNEFLEASQSFYSCSGRCNQHAFNFFQLKRNDFLEIPAHFSKFLVVQWQVQSEMLPNHCFSIEMNFLAIPSKSLTHLKISIRALAGAIQMLPNHCFSIEKQL